MEDRGRKRRCERREGKGKGGEEKEGRVVCPPYSH